MKSGKTAGPSGIAVEMIKAACDAGATMIRDLATAIICDGKVPRLGGKFHCLPLRGQG